MRAGVTEYGGGSAAGDGGRVDRNDGMGWGGWRDGRWRGLEVAAGFYGDGALVDAGDPAAVDAAGGVDEGGSHALDGVVEIIDFGEGAGVAGAEAGPPDDGGDAGGEVGELVAGALLDGDVH